MMEEATGNIARDGYAGKRDKSNVRKKQLPLTKRGLWDYAYDPPTVKIFWQHYTIKGPVDWTIEKHGVSASRDW